jgi:hypothetical protein
MPVYWVLGYGIVNNDKNDRLRKIIAVLAFVPNVPIPESLGY